MNLSNSLRSSLIDLLYTKINIDYSSLPLEASFNKNNVHNTFLTVNMSNGGEMDIPLIARAKIENLIATNNRKVPQETLAILLHSVETMMNVRSFDRAIRCSFPRACNVKLQPIIFNNGKVYYIGNGIILDRDYNPLMLLSLKANIDDHGLTNAISYSNLVIHVSPYVFEYPNEPISRGIIKKIIPYYRELIISGNYMPQSYGVSTYNHFDMKKTVTIVEDLSKFFVKPSKPVCNGSINDSINEFLVNNIEEVIENIT